MCLKMRIFLEKTVKSASASTSLAFGGLGLRAQILAYYYNFIESVSYARCVLYSNKRTK